MSKDKHWEKVVNSIPNINLKLGKLTADTLLNESNHLLFTFSRYKFASKMIGNDKEVLELGCSEGIGSLIIAENNCNIKAVDFDEDAILWAAENLKNKNIEFVNDDFINKKYGEFDAVVSIDVIEHIIKKNENKFLETVHKNLKHDGICIIGTPNITAKKYASKTTKDGHVNNFSTKRLKQLFLKKFRNVFIFGMNDEVLHTGFNSMSHYLILLACFPKK